MSEPDAAYRRSTRTKAHAARTGLVDQRLRTWCSRLLISADWERKPLSQIDPKDRCKVCWPGEGLS